jgi:uncharacterized protein YukE
VVVGDGFEVDPPALEAASERVRALATELATIGSEAAGPIGNAVITNLGFQTSAALGELDGRLGPVAQKLSEGLADHAAALLSNAKTYAQTDSRTAELFRRPE